MNKYQKVGVDIEGSNRVKEVIKKMAYTTYNQNVLAGVGSFGAMYDFSEIKKYKQPVLVQTMDGIGTKLLLAKAMNPYFLFNIGMDIVNHCINDILSQGARPLIFMDYIAQDKLREKEIIEIVRGMEFACKEGNISLIGGEIAQMPGVYQKEGYDVVGVMTGIVEKDQIINGSVIKPGDKIIGLPSSGLHTNGYSLIRRILRRKRYSLYHWIPELGSLLGLVLLRVHKSYLRAISLLLNNQFNIHGIAHITGGGLSNIIRILPEDCQARIWLKSWPILPIFSFIQKIGKISTEEMYRVFNMGIGIILIVSCESAEKIQNFLLENKEPCYLIGEITQGKKEVKFIS